MSQPALLFLPWVRRGGSLELPPDTPGAHPASHAASTAAVSVNNSPEAAVVVNLLGPGDVTGLARQQVIRTDPAPNARTFESNYLALIEFDEPALPWLFTPASATGGRLRPWLCLVVVREQDGVTLTPPTTGALQVLRVASPALPEVELPDLADSWAWAHAQLATEAVVGEAALADALAGDPGRSLSRLVSGRLLEPLTSYLACVVPTFEAGRLTGLGRDPGSAEGPAWRTAAGMGPVELPVYHHWRFATGEGGDFQSLALAIRGRPVPDGFGLRPVDLSTSGLGVPGADDVQVLLGGALLGLDAPPAHWSDEAFVPLFAGALREVLNTPDAANPAEPLLAPPRYGSAYREPATLDAAATGSWYEQLNLDPVARIAARLGTLVVQRHQETLVAAAWDQAADLRAAARLADLAGLGYAVAASLHRRHVAPLAPEVGLFVLAPLRARLLAAPASGAGPSFATQLAQAAVPSATLGTAVRRLARVRGPAVRRVVTRSHARLDILGSLTPVARLERTVSAPSGPLTLDQVAPTLPSPVSLAWAQVTAAAITAAPPRRGFAITPTPVPASPGGGVFDPRLRDGEFSPLPLESRRTRSTASGSTSLSRRRPDDPEDPLPEPPDPDPDPPTRPPRPVVDTVAAALFRTVAAAQLAAFLGPPPAPRPLPGGLALDAVFTEAVRLTDPRLTFPAVVSTLLAEPVAPQPEPVPVPTLDFAPRFSTPMVHALAELGQQWLLPGLDGVPADTALALRTNGAFVEAFLVGINHEFGRELLWREFPTPLTATFFDQFWDAAVAPGQAADVPPLADWDGRALGAPTVRPERFVLLLRSELIRRFPDAIVTAVDPSTTPPTEILPSFRGSLDPDVSYFGFGIGLDAAADHAVVIAEQPGAPRFGFEVGQAPTGVSHAPATDATAAALAGRLRQLPARLTIPVAVLLREPEPQR